MAATVGCYTRLAELDDRCPKPRIVTKTLPGEVFERECTDWLERLDRGEQVVVNLRVPRENATENVADDRPQVRQVLR